MGRSACGCEGSAPQAELMQSLAAENLLCSFPAPQRSAAQPRTALPAASPQLPRSFPQVPADFRGFPRRQSGQRRHRGGQGQGGGEGRGKGRLLSTPHLARRLAGLARSPLSLCFRRRERGRSRISLRRVWGRSQPGRGLTWHRGAEALRGSGTRPSGDSGDPRRRCNVFYICIFFKCQ